MTKCKFQIYLTVMGRDGRWAPFLHSRDCLILTIDDPSDITQFTRLPLNKASCHNTSFRQANGKWQKASAIIRWWVAPWRRDLSFPVLKYAKEQENIIKAVAN